MPVASGSSAVANRLKMAIVETIITLRKRGWSNRRIARELGIDRGTVARHLRGADLGSNTAIAPHGSAFVLDNSNAAIAPIGSATVDANPLPPPSRIGRPSNCAPFHALIVAACQKDLSAQRIYQDLVSDHGFTGSYFSVRRYVGRLTQRTE